MDSLSNVDLANIDLNDPEQTKDLSRETLNKLKHQQLHEQHKGQFSGKGGRPRLGEKIKLPFLWDKVTVLISQITVFGGK